MRNKAKIKVGLSQINNSFSGQNYLPYSVGLLQAYAQKHLKDKGVYDFLAPVYLRESVEQSVGKLVQAEIVFFSTYVWNIRQSLEIAKTLKSRNSDLVIVFGGPQVPDRVEGFLKANPFIDAAVHGEGEQAFLAILENDFFRMAFDHDWSKIPSVSYIDKQGTVLTNKAFSRITDVDKIPSPYLGGIFDPLMKSNPQEKWILVWETNRGCPFSCSFCDWGSAVQSKVFKFDLNRLNQEIDWASQHKIDFVFCADANFGILERDIDIAKYVAQTKIKTGFPHALSVQSTKNATERAYQTQKILSDAGLNKGVTLSLQSIDLHTLTNIKRANISSETYQELQRRFTRDKIETYTDLILGLPGETYQSFTKGVAKIVSNGQHNRIQFNNLSILPNAEMGNPAYQKEHAMQLIESPIVNFHGSLATTNNEIMEMQTLVVGTKTCAGEDWVKVRAFAWMCQLMYFNKILQVPLLLMQTQYSIPFDDLILNFTDKDLSKYPILKEVQTFFRLKAKDIQEGGSEYCPSPEWLNIWWPADEYIMIKLCAENKLDAFYQEAEALLQEFLAERFVHEASAILSEAVRLNKGLIKLPFQTEDLNLHLKHNVWDAYQAARVGNNIPVEKKSVVYKITRTSKVWESFEDWCREVIWWGNKKGAYMYTSVTSEPQLSGHF